MFYQKKNSILVYLSTGTDIEEMEHAFFGFVFIFQSNNNIYNRLPDNMYTLKHFSKMYINVRDTQSDVIKIKLIEPRLEIYNIILMVHGKYNFYMTTYVESKI